MPDVDIDLFYRTCRSSFDGAAMEAIRVSKAAAGRWADLRRGWATTLFTRICTCSVSTLTLVPGSMFSPKHWKHFDLSAVASLSRTLVEIYLAFFYLCIDKIDDIEWRSRLNLFHLHDCSSRARMFKEFDPGDPQIAGLEAQANELRGRLRSLSYFTSLSEKQQSVFLKGDKAFFLGRDQIVAKVGMDIGHFRAMYRFLSSHVHSLPLAFYRMKEREQGRGIESDIEKGYIATALDFAEYPIRQATQNMLELFPDIRSAPISAGPEVRVEGSSDDLS
jgi:hypothetical protein